MKDTIQTGMNYFLGLLGFISVIGVFPSIIAGIVFLITGLQSKNPKIKRRRIIWAIVLMILPPFIIIFTLISFAFVNTMLGVSGA